MPDIERGAPPGSEAPLNETLDQNQDLHFNHSAFDFVREIPTVTTASWDYNKTCEYLERYFALGLTPLPTFNKGKEKRPLVRWGADNWNPRSLSDVKKYIRPGVNWGLRTGSALTVVDLDNMESIAYFFDMNGGIIQDLEPPTAKTSRGIHLYFVPTEPVKTQPFDGMDIKGTGGFVNAPPSIHPSGIRYEFIIPLGDKIPVLDFSRLIFPDKKKQASQLRQGLNYSRATIDNSERLSTEGAPVGQRHNKMVRLIGHFINLNWEEEWIIEYMLRWNQKNEEPMLQDEVLETIRYCYKRYAKQNVATATYSFNSVAIATIKQFQYAEPAAVVPEPKPIPEIDYWQLEEWDPEIDMCGPPRLCGHQMRIVHNGKRFVSVRFSCGRWDCPNCSKFLKSQWVSHIIKMAAGNDLYVTYSELMDWGALRKAIARCGANYLRICLTPMTVILDRPLDGSVRIPNSELESFLDTVIPNGAQCKFISTSRPWRRVKNLQSDSPFTMVVHTWLPLKIQLEIAVRLGGKPTGIGNTWDAPEEIETEKWKGLFIKAITEKEEELKRNE